MYRFILIPLLALMVFVPLASQALEFDPYGKIQNVDLGKPDGDQVVPQLVVTIVNIVLGLLGLIAAIIVIYSGFSYLFAGGDSAKMKKASGILLGAVIGLLIIMAAWGITTYVFKVLNKATDTVTDQVN